MKMAQPFLLALLLTGCATLPPGQEVISTLAHDNAIPLTAVKLRNDAPLLGVQPVEGEFGPGAPVVELAKGNSYYRLFRLNPASGNLHLKVTSYCACLGFDKRVAVPLLRVLTKSGQVVSLLPDGYEYSVEGAHGFTPLSVTLDVTVPGAEAAYALVAADNSRPDSPISGINLNGLLHLEILSYPVGRFDIRYVSP